jgi:hypothetical protein
VAQTVAETRSWKQRRQALGGTVNTIREEAPDPLGRFLRERRALKHALGLGQGRRPGILRGAQRPGAASTDDRGAGHCAVRQGLGLSSARTSLGSGSPPRVSPVTKRGSPQAQPRRSRALGARGLMTAHSATLRPPWVAKRAARATAGRIARARPTKCGRTVNTALPVVHWTRQRGRRPSRTRPECEWRARRPPRPPVALWVS